MGCLKLHIGRLVQTGSVSYPVSPLWGLHTGPAASAQCRRGHQPWAAGHMATVGVCTQGRPAAGAHTRSGRQPESTPHHAPFEPDLGPGSLRRGGIGGKSIGRPGDALLESVTGGASWLLALQGNGTYELDTEGLLN